MGAECHRRCLVTISLPPRMRKCEDALDTKVMDSNHGDSSYLCIPRNDREGKIQVELAQLNTGPPILVGLRSSFSRLGGGIG